jgi:hypothetical protein
MRCWRSVCASVAFVMRPSWPRNVRPAKEGGPLEICNAFTPAFVLYGRIVVLGELWPVSWAEGRNWATRSRRREGRIWSAGPIRPTRATWPTRSPRTTRSSLPDPDYTRELFTGVLSGQLRSWRSAGDCVLRSRQETCRVSWRKSGVLRSDPKRLR